MDKRIEELNETRRTVLSSSVGNLCGMLLFLIDVLRELPRVFDVGDGSSKRKSDNGNFLMDPSRKMGDKNQR